jgi:hypothetical protein
MEELKTLLIKRLDLNLMTLCTRVYISYLFLVGTHVTKSVILMSESIHEIIHFIVKICILVFTKLPSL